MSKEITNKLSYAIWVAAVILAWLVLLIYAKISHKYNIQTQTVRMVISVVLLALGYAALRSQKVTGNLTLASGLLTVTIGGTYLFLPGCEAFVLFVPFAYGFSGVLQDEYGDPYTYDITQCLVASGTACMMLVAKTFSGQGSQISAGGKVTGILVNTILFLGAVAQFVLLFYHMQSECEALSADVDSAREKASLDPVTGIQDSSMMFETIERQKSSIETFSVLMIDIDDFKQVNTTYGHVFGDNVLRGLAHVMVNVSGEDCIHFRYSGDKFVVVCKAQDVIRAKETAEKIREGFQKIAFRNNESREHITVSVGIVDISYGDAKNAEQIVSIAEHALTTAKNSGKNRVCAYKERNYPR